MLIGDCSILSDPAEHFLCPAVGISYSSGSPHTSSPLENTFLGSSSTDAVRQNPDAMFMLWLLMKGQGPEWKVLLPGNPLFYAEN